VSLYECGVRNALLAQEKPGFHFVIDCHKMYVEIPMNDQLKELCCAAEEKQYDILVTKWLTRKRVKKIDIYNRRNDQWVITIIPLGHGSGIGHAISIVGDLIFNSTQAHALNFGKEALDWCCANDQGFKDVYMAVSFAFRKRIKYKQLI
jgi:hypothetical protein